MCASWIDYSYVTSKYFLDFLCQSVAERIKNKSVGEVFELENDFTPEEHEKVCAEVSMVLDGILITALEVFIFGVNFICKRSMLVDE